MSFYGKDFLKYFYEIENNRSDHDQDGTLHIFKHERKDFLRFSVHGLKTIKLLTDYHPPLQNDIKLITFPYTFNNNDENKLNCLSFNNYIYKKIINGFVRQKKIKVFEKRKSSSSSVWNISIETSPGNIQDIQDIIFESSSSFNEPCIICIEFENDVNYEISCCMIKTSLNEIFICEFMDNDELTNLESIIVQMNVSECLYKQSKLKNVNEKIENLMKKCDVSLKEVKIGSKIGKSDVVRGKLEKLLKTKFIQYEQLNKKLYGCIGCCIDHLNLYKNQNNYGFYKLKQYKHQTFMKLDSSVLRALQLFPLENATFKTTATGSLFGLLNQCKTKMGSRRLNNMLRQPLLNKNEIISRQDIVSALADDVLLSERITSSLKVSPDFDQLLKKFQLSKIKLKDLVDIYQFICTLKDVQKGLKENRGSYSEKLKKRYLSMLKEMDNNLLKYCRFIETIIDLSKLKEHEYLLSSDLSNNLKEIGNKMKRLGKRIKSTFEDIIDIYDLDEKTCKLEKITGEEDKGYCVAVKGKKKSKLVNKRGIIELKHTKNIKYITTKELQKYSRMLEKNVEMFKTEQSIMQEKVFNVAKSYVPMLEQITQFVCELDIFSTFAEVSTTYNYVRPEITDMEKDEIIILKGRHPCLEKLLPPEKQFIPNDLIMNRNQNRFQIITGPNMGGKSTFIKQNAIIILLAQIGMFVPCEKASISVREGIYARVGAADFILRGVSTFMAEMLDTSSILKNATNHSFIIIDELGRGTSTYDGFGLAWSISENIIKVKQSFCLFATHFHELHALENKFPCVKNFHMKVIQEEIREGVRKLTMLYEVKPGKTGESFGIEVAELVKFPQIVTERAKRKVEQLTLCEDFGLDFTNVDNVEEGGRKRKKRKISTESKTAGDDLIVDTITQFSQLPLNNLNIEEQKVKLNEFKKMYNNKIVTHPNKETSNYLQNLLKNFKK